MKKGQDELEKMDSESEHESDLALSCQKIRKKSETKPNFTGDPEPTKPQKKEKSKNNFFSCFKKPTHQSQQKSNILNTTSRFYDEDDYRPEINQAGKRHSNSKSQFYVENEPKPVTYGEERTILSPTEPISESHSKEHEMKKSNEMKSPKTEINNEPETKTEELENKGKRVDEVSTKVSLTTDLVPITKPDKVDDSRPPSKERDELKEYKGEKGEVFSKVSPSTGLTEIENPKETKPNTTNDSNPQDDVNSRDEAKYRLENQEERDELFSKVSTSTGLTEIKQPEENKPDKISDSKPPSNQQDELKDELESKSQLENNVQKYDEEEPSSKYSTASCSIEPCDEEMEVKYSIKNKGEQDDKIMTDNLDEDKSDAKNEFLSNAGSKSSLNAEQQKQDAKNTFVVKGENIKRSPDTLLTVIKTERLSDQTGEEMKGDDKNLELKPITITEPPPKLEELDREEEMKKRFPDEDQERKPFFLKNIANREDKDTQIYPEDSVYVEKFFEKDANFVRTIETQTSVPILKTSDKISDNMILDKFHSKEVQTICVCDAEYDGKKEKETKLAVKKHLSVETKQCQTDVCMCNYESSSDDYED